MELTDFNDEEMSSFLKELDLKRKQYREKDKERNWPLLLQEMDARNLREKVLSPQQQSTMTEARVAEREYDIAYDKKLWETVDGLCKDHDDGDNFFVEILSEKGADPLFFYHSLSSEPTEVHGQILYIYSRNRDDLLFLRRIPTEEEWRILYPKGKKMEVHSSPGYIRSRTISQDGSDLFVLDIDRPSQWRSFSWIPFPGYTPINNK